MNTINRVLTPEQIKYALRTANVTLISKECGIGYNSCHKLSKYDGKCSYNTSTLRQVSDYLLREYDELGKVYGLE